MKDFIDEIKNLGSNNNIDDNISLMWVVINNNIFTIELKSNLTYESIRTMYEKNIGNNCKYIVIYLEDENIFLTYIYQKYEVNIINKEVKIKVCFYCGKNNTSMKKCSKCKYAYYCSVDCQKEHWNTHKKTCKEMAIRKSYEDIIHNNVYEQTQCLFGSNDIITSHSIIFVNNTKLFVEELEKNKDNPLFLKSMIDIKICDILKYDNYNEWLSVSNKFLLDSGISMHEEILKNNTSINIKNIKYVSLLCKDTLIFISYGILSKLT